MTKLYGLLAVALLTSCIKAGAVTIGEEHKERARELVAAMTLDEKIDYLSGETSFSLRPVKRLGIPRIFLAVRLQAISVVYPIS